MSSRIRVNWNAVHDLLKSQATADVIKGHTRSIDNQAKAQGSQTRVDFAIEGERARGAVIAGYENGATAEKTRRTLLNSLDVGGVDKG